MTLKYRPEIDGLRAIAVLAVVFYHAEFLFWGREFMPGGFLGVDVFFVISGYLITSIILKELNGSGFSYRRFYERRARRILPAFFTVVVATFPLAWTIMLPKALMEYARSLLWALGFSGNFYFWQEDSYTAEPSLLKPFLHTWSLAIEEQFYFIFPVCLIFLSRYFKKSIGLVLIVGTLASFALAEIFNQKFVDASFYLLHTRAWELLAGSLMAYWEGLWGKRRSPPFFTQWMPPLGVALLLLPMLWLKDSMPHPSHFTVPAVLGTCLVIWFCHPQATTTRILGSRPLRGVGLISYSLYLWHFPLFAFARIQYGSLLDSHRWWLILASMGLAIATFFFVESPTRNKTVTPLPYFLKGLSVSFLAIVGVLIVLNSTKGAPWRLKNEVAVMDSIKHSPVMQNGKDCHSRTLQDLCEFGSASATNVLLNIGDSHADMFGPALKQIASDLNLTYVHMTFSACPYVHDIYAIENGKLYQQCNPEFQTQWRQKIQQYKNPIVVYTGRFPLYLDQHRFENSWGGKEPGKDFWISLSPTEFDRSQVQNSIVHTLKELVQNSKMLVLVYPVPEVGWDVPKYVQSKIHDSPLQQWAADFKKLEIKTPFSDFQKRTQITYETFNSIESAKVVRVYPAQTLCDQVHCYAKNEEALFYKDDNHLAPAMAKAIIQSLRPELEKRLNIDLPQ